MQINSNSLVSISETNQNFSKIARIVDKLGYAVISKNNKLKYVLIDYSKFLNLCESENEMIDMVARKVLEENIDAFKELA